MAIVVGAYDPNDWRPYLVRGARLCCDGGLRLINPLLPAACDAVAIVAKAGEMPAGWMMVRETHAAEDGNSLVVYCPRCDPVFGVNGFHS